MKKILFVVLVMSLCGCGFLEEPYKGFEHSDLKDVKKKIFTLNENNYKEVEEYVLINETLEKSEDYLYYKVAEDDYILLDKTTIATSEFFDDSRCNVLYGNRLFLLTNIGFIKEYQLNKENTTNRNIKFDYSRIYESGIEGTIEFSRIEKIEKGYMYLCASIRNDYTTDFIMKCSIENYKCEKDDDIRIETDSKIDQESMISERKKAFSEEILNKFIEYGNVDKDNLKTFNIERILNIGYYASKSDEIYYQVAFNYECKDGGRSCVSLEINDDSLYEFEGNYYFSLVAKNDKVIKIMSGVAFNFNSDYVPQQEEIK